MNMLLKLYQSLRMEMSSGTVLGYFLQALPIALLVGMGYAVLRLVYLKRRRRRIHWPREVMGWLFACYLTGLCSLVILPAGFWRDVYDGIFFGWWDNFGAVFRMGEVNLVPTLLLCLSGEYTLGSWVKEMLLGNIVMLMPLGSSCPL